MRLVPALLYSTVTILFLSFAFVISNINKLNEVESYNLILEQKSTSDTAQPQLINELRNEILQLTKRIDELESPKNKYRRPKIMLNLNRYKPIKRLPFSAKKRILITGGAGFVGSHLLDRLMAYGHKVIVVDNFDTGRRSNIEHWIGHPNFELIQHDVVNPLFIEVDEIYHLASPASPPHYMIDSVKTIKTNTIGTINMLGLAKRVGAKFFLASTSEIYGDPEVHPQKETYWGNVNSIGPRSCYDEGKRAAEALAYAYAKQKGVNIRVARIFNTYGPRMYVNDGRVVSNFVTQALQGKPLTIYGSGNQTRSFQYVSDLIEGIVRLMDSDYTKPVNLGNPDEYTIKDFANIVLMYIHLNQTIDLKDFSEIEVHSGPKNSTPVWSPFKQSPYSNDILHSASLEDDPRRRRPEITLAKQLLHWSPNISLSEGLHNTIEYFKGELKLSGGKKFN